MQKFEHKLRTTLHTRSIENIMMRSHGSRDKSRQHRTSQPKLDNITTYLRKFQIDRENFNLAKRIMNCESDHSRKKYAREWKKTKKFLKVRCNFKPQLTGQEPRMYRIEETVGHGRLLVNIQFQSIQSHMKLLSSNSLYFLRFTVSGSQLVPNKLFLTLDTSPGYTCTFLAPHFLKSRPITARLIKVIQNNLFEAGRFGVDLACNQLQRVSIYGKSGQLYGYASMKVSTQLLQRGGSQEKQNKLSDRVTG